MPNLLQDEDFQKLKQSLPTVFREQFLAEDAILAQAYPLLNLICPERELLSRLQNALAIPTPELTQDKLNHLIAIADELTGQFQAQALFKYRLPLILSEFPIHSRAINHAIQAFNELVEAYHQGEQALLAEEELETCYEALIEEIRKHGSYCACESLWQLLGMMTGWSKLSPPTSITQRVPSPLGGSISSCSRKLARNQHAKHSGAGTAYEYRGTKSLYR